jgi:hypothetical protein
LIQHESVSTTWNWNLLSSSSSASLLLFSSFLEREQSGILSSVMASSLSELDAHEQPSEHLRAEWKSLGRLNLGQVNTDARIDDPSLPLESSSFGIAGNISTSQLREAFAHLDPLLAESVDRDAPILEHHLVPGLFALPMRGFIPIRQQKADNG